MEWYIGNEWKLDQKGLHKKVVDLQFSKLEKPHDSAKIIITFEYNGLHRQPSNWLNKNKNGQQQELLLGSALTPVDYYIEILIKQMIVGETAECTIKTNDDDRIVFQLSLNNIIENTAIHKLTPSEMFALAEQYKDNGVNIFKEYPLIAHEYFARATKCLLSFKPFDNFTLESEGVAAESMQILFIQLQTNLAASLLQQKRYEDVIYVTAFVDKDKLASEKAVFRRAMAFMHLREYELAQKTIEAANYKENEKFQRLLQQIKSAQKISYDEYKHVVQRMFS